MFLIKKITQHYDPEQDRIGLTVQNTEGQVMMLWLTQRLVNRLASVLADWLDRDVKTMAGEHSIFSLHVWEQSAAKAQLKPEFPVEQAAAQSEALVNVVDLGRAPDGRSRCLILATSKDRLLLCSFCVRLWILLMLFRLMTKLRRS